MTEARNLEVPAAWWVIPLTVLVGCGGSGSRVGTEGVSVDASIRAVAQTALERALRKSGAPAGFVMVADARTGFVLVTESQGGPPPARLDPASLNKPLIVSAAVEQGLTRFDELVDCGPQQRGVDTFAALTTADAIVRSSNRCIAPIAARLDPGTSIEESVAPEELVRAYAAIANGGVVGDERVISESTAAGLKLALARAVAEGTGRNARSGLVSTAGKTGTFVGPTADGWAKEGVSLFLGFAPVDDPSLVVFAAVADPADRQPLGNRHAAPLFREVVERALTLPESRR